jgi:mannose-6-phosphate isomerase
MRDLPSPIGEAWLTARECRVATGPFAGKQLAEAWERMPIEWRGEAFRDVPNFPLLVKFIFPTDKLSIQVHPDDAYAAAHEAAADGTGKTEMWHAVSAERGAQVLVGLKPGVTKENFLSALANHTVEDLFQSHAVQPGDTFFIPAGTPHTIGPGLVFCEVQQYSDLTYRLYDYNRFDTQGRPRQLHIEKALSVMNFNSSSAPKITPGIVRNDKQVCADLLDCPYFSTRKLQITNSFQMNAEWCLGDQFTLWIFLEGQGRIDLASKEHPQPGNSRAREFTYRPGECWFFPADLGSYTFYPQSPTTALAASPRNGKLDA